MSNDATMTKRVSHKRKSSKERELPPTMGKRLLSLGWNVLFYVIFLSILLGALLFNFNDSPDKSFYGYRFMTVKTNSMAANPAKPEYTDGFNAGDMIIIKRVEAASLKPKDIITFYPVAGNTTAYLTHRIIESGTPVINEEGEEVAGFTTEGDANDNADVPIQPKQVVGKVIGHIPNIGVVIQFVRDNLVVVLVLISIVFVFLATLKYYLSIPKVDRVSNQVSRKRHKRRSSKRR